MSFGIPLSVDSGGTGLNAGTSGGILGFTSSSTMASSAMLVDNALVLGGGVGATPSTPVDLGSTTAVLHGNASGPPSWGAVVEVDISLSSNTTNDATITKHGFLPMLSGSSSQFLNGLGVFTAPSFTSTTPTITGQIPRWNQSTLQWEVASEPFNFKGITLTPAAAALVVAEGHIYYNSGSKDIQVCTSAV